MPGIYIHIPLCRKVCYYCDFHFVASLKYKKELIQAIIKEIKIRSCNWSNIKFSTLYFGGGTPSILTISEINEITETIYANYNLAPDFEFTFESNPDDLTPEYLKNLKHKTKINRLSIGIQSFHNKDLTFINRRHDGEQAERSILNAKEAGFDNISVDLIYGIPGLSLSDWKKNVEQFIHLNIPHLAAYHLSIEPKTVFGVFKQKNKIHAVNEELSIRQYEFLIETLKSEKFEHYEISNFAKYEKYSKHNNGYWFGEKYIGIGPSAHSFNGNLRRWNISNNSKYQAALLEKNEIFFEEEELSVKDRLNDYLLTSLRTMWGADLNYIRENFGVKYHNHYKQLITGYIKKGVLKQQETRFSFTEKGWFISDSVLTDLFYE